MAVPLFLWAASVLQPLSDPFKMPLYLIIEVLKSAVELAHFHSSDVSQSDRSDL